MVYKRLERILIQLDVVDSTNDYAANLLKSGKVHSGTTILAKEQLKGRGQRASSWTSEPGKNLMFSIIFSEKLIANKSFYLNMAVSLAVRKTLADLGIASKIKWPNDILVDGKKIAGILIENQLQGNTVMSSILGVGLNVNQTKYNSEFNATSVQLELMREIELMDLFEQLFAYLDFYLNLLLESNFQILEKHYLEFLYQKNEMCRYEDATGRFQGKIIGINSLGFLQIEVSGEIRTYDIKELSYL